MTPIAWAERLERFRKNQKEEYARAILEEPPRVNLYQALKFPGVAMEMGDIRTGKTGLAHEIAHVFHEKRNLPAALHLPNLNENTRKKIQKMVPPWMKICSRKEEWPTGAVIIYDEAAQSAHARRAQGQEAIELDDLLSIAGQRQQLIIFISHFSRKLDLNVCTGVHRIIWKRPTFAHQLWERDEIADFTARAYRFFSNLKSESLQKKTTLILNMDKFGFSQCTNKLPPWWSDDLSCAFRDAAAITSNKRNLLNNKR